MIYMHVVFQPKDPARGDRQEWLFDPGDVFADEAELIETHFEGTWGQFVAGVRTESAKALRLLFWHLMRTSHIEGGNRGPAPNLKDVPRFKMGELEVHQSSAELRDLLTELEGAPLGDEQKRLTLAAVSRQIERALEREALDSHLAQPAAEEPAPAAPSPPPALASGPNFPGLDGWTGQGQSGPQNASQAVVPAQPVNQFDHTPADPAAAPEPTATIVSPVAFTAADNLAASQPPLPDQSEPSGSATG